MDIVKGFSMEEYLTIFVAFIYGHITSHFFSNWGAWIQNRKNIRFNLRHIALTVLVFVLIIDIWWTIFNRTALVTQNKILFVISLTVPINLYVLANVLFPKLGLKHTDMPHYFHKNERLIYLLLGLNFLLNSIIAVSIGELGFLDWENLFRIIAFTICVIVSIAEQRPLRIFFLVVGFILMAIHVFVQGDAPEAVGPTGFMFVDYVTIFSAFVYGYVATMFLTGWSYLVQHLKKIEFGNEYFAWTVLVFGLLIDVWWVSWRREPFAASHLGFFLMSLTSPLIYYMLSNMLFPLLKNDADMDMSGYFRANKKDFYGLFGILFVINFVVANTMEEQGTWLTNYFRLSAIGLAILAYFSKSVLVHRIVLAVSWVVFIVHIMVN